MRFLPGQDVLFRLDDGTEVTARPFFFQRPPARTFDVEFITTDGRRIRFANRQRQEFHLVETGQRCFLEEPAFRE
jgi:hypothetical protein